MNILLVTLLLLLAGTLSVSAQIVNAEGQYVDTVFNDNVDRTAEDFVIASILISDPIEGVLSPAGHTAIRLQCPTFGLDYVYHYVMLNTVDSISEQKAFFTGQFYVRMLADTFATYFKDNQEVGRGFTEYPLFITPKEKQQLWQVLDETLEKSQQLKYDFVEEGCCVRTKKIIRKVLGEKKIDYSACDVRFSEPSYKLVGEAMTHVPWLHFVMMTAMYGNSSSKKLEDKLLIPQDLISAWQKATVDGKPLVGEGVRVLPDNNFKSNLWVTPLHVAIFLLLLSIVSLFIKAPYMDWIIMGMQVTMAIVVLVFSLLASSFMNWNWLLIPFNLLPIILWRWRKYWALPYAGILIVWCSVMLFVPHMLVDTTHIILVLTFVIVLFKQSNILSRLFDKCESKIMKYNNKNK